MAFFTLDGIELPVERGQFRQSADEVSPTGVVARVWQVAIHCVTPTQLAAVRSRASWSLRRSLGWQLRGQGHGDVAMGDEALGGATATVRFEIEGAVLPTRHYQVISIRAREQVS